MKSKHQQIYNKEWMRANRASEYLKNGEVKYWQDQAKIRLKESVKKLNEMALEYHLSMRKHEWWKVDKPDTSRSGHKSSYLKDKKTFSSRISSFFSRVFSS